MNRIRLILADDHVMVAQGLQSLLCDEFDLLGTVGNGRELVEWTLDMKPDVILVDISMPVLNGFDAVRELRKRGSESKIIFLTMHNDSALLAEAFRCGASGYILKQAAGEELVNAIKEVYGKVLGQEGHLSAHERKIAFLNLSKADKAEAEALRADNAKLKARADKVEQENTAIKAYLCEKDPQAAFCR